MLLVAGISSFVGRKSTAEERNLPKLPLPNFLHELNHVPLMQDKFGIPAYAI